MAREQRTRERQRPRRSRQRLGCPRLPATIWGSVAVPSVREAWVGLWEPERWPSRGTVTLALTYVSMGMGLYALLEPLYGPVVAGFAWLGFLALTALVLPTLRR